MAKQMSLIKNIDIGYFALKGKESLVITSKFENIFNLVLFHTSVIIVHLNKTVHILLYT